MMNRGKSSYLPIRFSSTSELILLGKQPRRRRPQERQKSNRFRLTKQQICTLLSFSFHMQRFIFPEKEKDRNRFAKTNSQSLNFGLCVLAKTNSIKIVKQVENSLKKRCEKCVFSATRWRSPKG